LPSSDSLSGVDLGGRVQGVCTPPPPQDEAFFFVFAFKFCLPHKSVVPFLSGAPSPKKNPGSSGPHLWLRPWCVTVQMKAREHNLYVVLFVSELGVMKFSSIEVLLYFAIILFTSVLDIPSQRQPVPVLR